ncbi:hypothetical protein [Kitasatospora sp. CB01950]|uniref:hypothetical protein n=1 Tax=Kitasatospora sp. CB01950 TaxID=1703930 RepID=UPI00093B4A65|nr:hypothetical protein [Kitasatospora sp. CB01950]OKI99997.1 hypothetical protein AMK19_30010 [Kitasatospora sp. CB01950]
MRKNLLRRATAALLGAAAIALMAPAGTASASGYAVLGSGSTLLPGERLVAYRSALTMQEDGNLVLHLCADAGGACGPVIWNSGTWGHPGAYAYMQEDGNLVVYRKGGSRPSDALWSSRTWGHPGAYLFLHADATMLIEAPSGTPPTGWTSDTGKADAGADVPQGERGAVITSARSLDPGHWLDSGTTWLVNQPDGNLVLYRKRDGAAIWSSGTWGRPRSSLSLSQSPLWPALGLHRIDNGSRTWSTPLKGRAGIHGVAQSDGNFVIYTDDGTALWNTGTWGRT